MSSSLADTNRTFDLPGTDVALRAEPASGAELEASAGEMPALIDVDTVIGKPVVSDEEASASRKALETIAPLDATQRAAKEWFRSTREKGVTGFVRNMFLSNPLTNFAIQKIAEYEIANKDNPNIQNLKKYQKFFNAMKNFSAKDFASLGGNTIMTAAQIMIWVPALQPVGASILASGAALKVFDGSFKMLTDPQLRGWHAKASMVSGLAIGSVMSSIPIPMPANSLLYGLVGALGNGFTEDLLVISNKISRLDDPSLSPEERARSQQILAKHAKLFGQVGLGAGRWFGGPMIQSFTAGEGLPGGVERIGQTFTAGIESAQTMLEDAGETMQNFRESVQLPGLQSGAPLSPNNVQAAGIGADFDPLGLGEGLNNLSEQAQQYSINNDPTVQDSSGITVQTAASFVPDNAIVSDVDSNGYADTIQIGDKKYVVYTTATDVNDTQQVSTQYLATTDEGTTYVLNKLDDGFMVKGPMQIGNPELEIKPEGTFDLNQDGRIDLINYQGNEYVVKQGENGIAEFTDENGNKLRIRNYNFSGGTYKGDLIDQSGATIGNITSLNNNATVELLDQPIPPSNNSGSLGRFDYNTLTEQANEINSEGVPNYLYELRENGDIPDNASPVDLNNDNNFDTITFDSETTYLYKKEGDDATYTNINGREVQVSEVSAYSPQAVTYNVFIREGEDTSNILRVNDSGAVFINGEFRGYDIDNERYVPVEGENGEVDYYKKASNALIDVLGAVQDDERYSARFNADGVPTFEQIEVEQARRVLTSDERFVYELQDTEQIPQNANPVDIDGDGRPDTLSGKYIYTRPGSNELYVNLDGVERELDQITYHGKTGIVNRHFNIFLRDNEDTSLIYRVENTGEVFINGGHRGYELNGERYIAVIGSDGNPLYYEKASSDWAIQQDIDLGDATPNRTEEGRYQVRFNSQGVPTFDLIENPPSTLEEIIERNGEISVEDIERENLIPANTQVHTNTDGDPSIIYINNEPQIVYTRSDLQGYWVTIDGVAREVYPQFESDGINFTTDRPQILNITNPSPQGQGVQYFYNGQTVNIQVLTDGRGVFEYNGQTLYVDLDSGVIIPSADLSGENTVMTGENSSTYFAQLTELDRPIQIEGDVIINAEQIVIINQITNEGGNVLIFPPEAANINILAQTLQVVEVDGKTCFALPENCTLETFASLQNQGCKILVVPNHLNGVVVNITECETQVGIQNTLNRAVQTTTTVMVEQRVVVGQQESFTVETVPLRDGQGSGGDSADRVINDQVWANPSQFGWDESDLREFEQGAINFFRTDERIVDNQQNQEWLLNRFTPVIGQNNAEILLGIREGTPSEQAALDAVLYRNGEDTQAMRFIVAQASAAYYEIENGGVIGDGGRMSMQPGEPVHLFRASVEDVYETRQVTTLVPATTTTTAVTPIVQVITAEQLANAQIISGNCYVVSGNNITMLGDTCTYNGQTLVLPTTPERLTEEGLQSSCIVAGTWEKSGDFTVIHGIGPRVIVNNATGQVYFDPAIIGADNLDLCLVPNGLVLACEQIAAEPRFQLELNFDEVRESVEQLWNDYQQRREDDPYFAGQMDTSGQIGVMTLIGLVLLGRRRRARAAATTATAATVPGATTPTPAATPKEIAEAAENALLMQMLASGKIAGVKVTNPAIAPNVKGRFVPAEVWAFGGDKGADDYWEDVDTLKAGGMKEDDAKKQAREMVLDRANNPLAPGAYTSVPTYDEIRKKLGI